MEYREHAQSHFETLSYRVEPTEPSTFWEILRQLPDNDTERTEQIRQRLTLAEVLRANKRMNLLVEELCNAAEEETKGSLTNDPWEAAAYVTCLGQETYERERQALSLFIKRVNTGDFNEGSSALFDYWGWIDDATDEEFEEALRQGSTIRTMGDPNGLGQGELIEHPELGLGFVLVDDAFPWVWLLFREDNLSAKRHESPEKHITLYQSGKFGLEYWYASVGQTNPSRYDLFESSGLVGLSHTPRVYEPRPREEAFKLFESLIQRKKSDGFIEAPQKTTQLVVKLSGCGLAKNKQLPRSALESTIRLLRSSGNGHYSQQRIAAEETHLYFEVVDKDRAQHRIKGNLPRISGLTVFSIEEGTPTLPVVPVEISEELPYFSKLSITAHPDTNAWATKTTAQAIQTWAQEFGVSLDGSLDSLSQLDTLIEAYKTKNLSKEALQMTAEQIGSYAGECLRREVGGDWGVGTLFTERIWFGLLLGERKLKWWPVSEARRCIDGSSKRRFSERCHTLIQAAKSKQEQVTERLYPLACHEGYFDAGVTADGRQALMAAFYPRTFAFFFDAEGRLLEYASQPTPQERSEKQPSYGPSRLSLERWQSELGFQPKNILVRRFSNADQGVGIEDLPSHFVDFLEDPEKETEEERQHTSESIQRWIEEGEFVLYWGNDLWLNKDGHVTSS
jgi:hypothetical protein